MLKEKSIPKLIEKVIHKCPKNKFEKNSREVYFDDSLDRCFHMQTEMPCEIDCRDIVRIRIMLQRNSVDAVHPAFP